MTKLSKVMVFGINKNCVNRRKSERINAKPYGCKAVGEDGTMLLSSQSGLRITFDLRKKLMDLRADLVVKRDDIQEVLLSSLLDSRG